MTGNHSWSKLEASPEMRMPLRPRLLAGFYPSFKYLPPLKERDKQSVNYAKMR